MITKNHHFFLLRPRPLPLVGSFLSFNLLFSVFMILKYGEFTPFLLSFLSLRTFSFFWWVGYRAEMNSLGNLTEILERGIKRAMILFISSEVFFFFSFFWSYFHYFLSPSFERGMSWPPLGVLSFDCLNVPLINTLILLSSGITATMRHSFIINNKKWWGSFWLILTVFLGMIFTFLQGLEYANSFFSIRDRNFGTSFFILTGFHGLHVIIGSIFLLTVFLRFYGFSSCKDRMLRFEMAAWYWHFVDVVWIFLYFFLYYINV